MDDVETISLGNLLKKQFTPGNHMIGGGLLHRGSLLVIGGGPKAWKSVISCSMMAHLATAKPLFNIHRVVRETQREYTFPINEAVKTILYLEQEIGEEDLKDRFQAYIKGLNNEARILCSERIHIHSRDGRMRLDTKDGVDNLREVIARVGPQVVFFDPLIEFHSKDENNASDMMKVLQPLTALMMELEFSAVVNHHSTKPNEKNGRYGAELLRGSSALHGKGDSFMMLKKDGKENGKVRVTFDLRRGRKVRDLFLKVNEDNFHVDFMNWADTPKGKTAEFPSASLIQFGAKK